MSDESVRWHVMHQAPPAVGLKWRIRPGPMAESAVVDVAPYPPRAADEADEDEERRLSGEDAPGTSGMRR